MQAVHYAPPTPMFFSTPSDHSNSTHFIITEPTPITTDGMVTTNRMDTVNSIQAKTYRVSIRKTPALEKIDSSMIR